MDNPPLPTLPAAQANALAAVIELESLWENVAPSSAQVSPREAWRGLNAKQRAYDAYQTQLTAYNRQFRPAHHCERPATTPKRLGGWCRRMAAVYGRADSADCPVQSLEKAYRCADRLAERLGVQPCPRAATTATATDAVAALAALANWCGELAARDPA